MPSKGGKPSGSATAFTRLQEQIKVVDLIIEVLDGRAPLSSRHPNAAAIFANKPRLVVYTKEDLSDIHALKPFSEHVGPEDEQLTRISLSLKTQAGKERFINTALKMTEAKREALAKRGVLPRPMRAIVVGMPNVGKSSLINWLVGRNKAKVANTPGVTRGPQWVRMHPKIELLDTPGVLPHIALRPQVVTKLALLGLVPEKIYEHEDVAREGLVILAELYPKRLEEYIESDDFTNANLEYLCERRNFLTHGGRADTSRAASTFLTDLRAGRVGRITLDRAEQTL